MPAGPTAVYILCFLASSLCAALLTRSYRRSRAQILLWSAVCFVLLAVNNLLVVIDLVLLPHTDLSVYRNATAFVALCFLLYGFIWEAER